jgi:hypothetical protein
MLGFFLGTRIVKRMRRVVLRAEKFSFPSLVQEKWKRTQLDVV